MEEEREGARREREREALKGPWKEEERGLPEGILTKLRQELLQPCHMSRRHQVGFALNRRKNIWYVHSWEAHPGGACPAAADSAVLRASACSNFCSATARSIRNWSSSLASFNMSLSGFGGRTIPNQHRQTSARKDAFGGAVEGLRKGVLKSLCAQGSLKYPMCLEPRVHGRLNSVHKMTTTRLC